ncbi:MAG TPA: hypothetical protein VL400_20580 [Polyangiaceae bacterium]|jgi:hypothetical protein|nr:hypothetical protein [Polyangiaceae bacterium]
MKRHALASQPPPVVLDAVTGPPVVVGPLVVVVTLVEPVVVVADVVEPDVVPVALLDVEPAPPLPPPVGDGPSDSSGEAHAARTRAHETSART